MALAFLRGFIKRTNMIKMVAVVLSVLYSVCFFSSARHKRENDSDQNKIVLIEAESFTRQHKDQIRKWHVVTVDTDSIAATASGKKYIEILPDTRKTHADPLIHGENFSNEPGKIGIVDYEINFTHNGRYFVWVSAFSTGTEDNGIHVGLNGQWPASGQRIQLCEGKGKWTWTNRQRTEKNHCGEPYLIYLDVNKSGKHTVQFSMREDGFRFDRFLLTKDSTFTPSDI